MILWQPLCLWLLLDVLQVSNTGLSLVDTINTHFWLVDCRQNKLDWLWQRSESVDQWSYRGVRGALQSWSRLLQTRLGLLHSLADTAGGRCQRSGHYWQSQEGSDQAADHGEQESVQFDIVQADRLRQTTGPHCQSGETTESWTLCLSGKIINVSKAQDQDSSLSTNHKVSGFWDQTNWQRSQYKTAPSIIVIHWLYQDARVGLGTAERQFVESSLGILASVRRRQQTILLLKHLTQISDLCKTLDTAEHHARDEDWAEAIRLYLGKYH